MYFTQQTLTFLNDLSANNNRDWFAEHKKDYEALVKKPATACAAQIAAELSRETGTQHREKIFRIHRDVRFSKDKTPYNAHIHISFLPQDGPSSRPAWMLGVSPDYFTLGCGVMAFDKAGLATFREKVAGVDGQRFATVLSDLSDKGVRIGEAELKRVPAPYEKDHPRGDLLRHKGLMGWIDGADPDEGIGPAILDRSMAGFGRLRPLFDLLMEPG